MIKLFKEFDIFSLFLPIDDHRFDFYHGLASFSEYSILCNGDIFFLPA